MRLGTIVEGQADVFAVPVLLRRLAPWVVPNASPEITRPFRLPRSKMLKRDELGRAVDFISRQLSPADGILIILDADEDCPATEAPRILRHAHERSGGRRVAVVFAVSEFESWLIASVESMRGCRGLSADVAAPGNPERIRGAKEWLSDQMKTPYAATVDQPALAALIDFELARKCSSFDKLCRELARLLSPA